MYEMTTGYVLRRHGYVPMLDFEVYQTGLNDCDLVWHSNAPKPSPAEVAVLRLAVLREDANTLRSTERVRRQTGGFPFGGHRYRSDREESIPLMVSAAIHAQVALAMGEEATALYNAALGNGWRDETGTARLTTAQEILGLHGAFVAWGSACDRASQQIAVDIDAAETIEDLEGIIAAIPTDSRWPE